MTTRMRACLKLSRLEHALEAHAGHEQRGEHGHVPRGVGARLVVDPQAAVALQAAEGLWTSSLGVEGSLTNPDTPGGQDGGEEDPAAVHRRVQGRGGQAAAGGRQRTDRGRDRAGAEPRQLSGWRNEHLAAGSAEALAARKAEQAETQRLKREVKRLEEEVEILRKAAAFFARGIA